MMKRACLAIVVLMMCLLPPLCAVAEGLEPSEEITGIYGGLSYAFPQFIAVTDADAAINEALRAMAEKLPDGLLGGGAPDEMDSAADEGMPDEKQVHYEVTRNDERYLSVLMTAQQFAGNGASETLYGLTFARDGLYAGQTVNLSQVLGLEQSAAVDGGEPQSTVSLAAQLAYRLVWDIVRVEKDNVDGDYLDGVDEAALARAFEPETDFYLDADGNVVFFIQSGILTGEVAGTLRFPFAPEEMLSAVKDV